MNKLKFLTLAILTVLVFLFFVRVNRNQEPTVSMLKSEVTTVDPPSIQMYFYIEKYAQEFDIPRNFAYGIAFCETRYGGPFDWNYNPYLTSPAGALGPMQVMPGTAKFINGSRPTNETLRTDIAYNVRTSMKLLRYLKDKYHDWKIVFGCYNTGRPLINGYAHKVYNFKPTW
jgi:soluble lytic murein transglycosylase-like protein